MTSLRAAPLMPLMALALCGASQAHGAPAPLANGVWSAAPPMRNARAAHAVVSTGTRIYALAGTGTGGRPVLEVERFDGARWEAEGALPGEGLNAPAAAIVDTALPPPSTWIFPSSTTAACPPRGAGSGAASRHRRDARS